MARLRKKSTPMDFPGCAPDQFLWLDPHNWPGFCQLVAAFYCSMGCSAANVPSGQTDVLVFSRGDKKTLLQCTSWTAADTTAQSVRDLYHSLLEERAERAVLMSSGFFSPEAVNFAAGKPLLLLDGGRCLELAPRLHQFLRQRQALPHARRAGNLLPPIFVPAVRPRLCGLRDWAFSDWSDLSPR